MKRKKVIIFLVIVMTFLFKNTDASAKEKTQLPDERRYKSSC